MQNNHRARFYESQWNLKARSPFQYHRSIKKALKSDNECQERALMKVAHEIWNSTVRVYTKGSLTKASDKLIAISALAREIQPLMRSQYCAGLWGMNLVHQLTWYVSSEPTFRPTGYRAPSWSWASVDGEIKLFSNLSYFKDNDGYPLIKVIEVITDTSGRDEFGQVQGGHLKLLGQIIDFGVATITPKATHGYDILIDPRVKHLKFALDAYERTEFKRRGYCLPISISVTRQTDEFCFDGLLLERIDVASNTYRRIGLLSDYLTGLLENYRTSSIKKYFDEDPMLSLIAGRFEREDNGRIVYKPDPSKYTEITIV